MLIRITPERKDEWEDELEESPFTSMAELIRFAMNNEINGRDSGSEGATSTFKEVMEEQSGDLDSHHRDVMRELNALQSAVGGIQEELDSMVEIGQDEIIEQLPVIQHSDYQEDGSIPVGPNKNINDMIYNDAKSPEEVARSLDYPVQPVERTLQRLVMKSDRIESLYSRDVEEERYYINE